MKMANDLSKEAREGWEMVSGNPYLWSSNLWLAFEAGAYARKIGADKPVRARVSRGYSIRLKPAGGIGMKVVFDTKTLTKLHNEIDFAA
jgi:hypothetical protein